MAAVRFRVRSRDSSTSGSRGGSEAASSPTVVCLTRGWSYGSLRRRLTAAFIKPLSDLNRNSSFAFRPSLTLSHRVVELSEFSPPEVQYSSLSTTRCAPPDSLGDALRWRRREGKEGKGGKEAKRRAIIIIKS